MPFCCRREDREPGKHTRVCSCHFRDGKKSNGPEIFKRNENKLFPAEEAKPKKKKIKSQQTLQEMIEAARKKEEFEQGTSDNLERPESTREVILEAELEQAKREIIDQKEKKWLYKKTLHSTNIEWRCFEDGNWAPNKGSVSHCCQLCR